MLILSRKCRESVVVGGSSEFQKLLKVTVLEIREGKVTLGFEVDENVPIHRVEVWRRIRARIGAAARAPERAAALVNA